MTAAVLGRSEAIYGEDADKFRPQRWTGSGGETLDRYNLVFGCNTRTCIGKNASHQWLNETEYIPGRDAQDRAPHHTEVRYRPKESRQSLDYHELLVEQAGRA
ncbi:hypothetical protein E4T47_05943 [Aureobasidium subglaciale]|nr:hypothetical protein E4T47_05943 [Aureobasidium subglaciale]